MGTGSMDQHAQRIATDFRLNTDQMSVLHHCSLWAASGKVSITPCASTKCTFAAPGYAKLARAEMLTLLESCPYCYCQNLSHIK